MKNEEVLIVGGAVTVQSKLSQKTKASCNQWGYLRQY